ncbi:MAG: TylF/MycF/NovP-related O-methyltransferase [Candidatus Saccharimonas sp.]
MITDTLLKNHPIISNQVDPRELRVVLHELEQLLQAGKTGAVVELGCYVGTTSLFLRRLLDAYNYTGELHVYDSFEGLPSKTSEDQSVAGDQFVTGELHATRKQLIQNFKKAGLKLPVIHKGWFSDLTTHDIPATVMFAFLDGDYYESIKDSFRVVTPRLAPEATILVDDYASEALPGAAQATNEWARQHHLTVQSQASLGIIRLRAQ